MIIIITVIIVEVDCKGVNVVPGTGEKRPGGAPSQKHLLIRERQRVRPEVLSFSIPFFL